MATFEDIKKANETISTTKIKGKEYAEVNQRIKAFRMVYPEGKIETEIISLNEGLCTIKATISNDRDVLGTGYAQEREGSSFINETSFIENCETSAVGRALGMCGFGIDTNICSAEELQNALVQQENKKKPKKEDSQNTAPSTIERDKKIKCIRCHKDIEDYTYITKDNQVKTMSGKEFASRYGGKCPDCTAREKGKSVKV